MAGFEDTGIALDLSAALVDQEGSESLSLLVLGLPEGASLSAGTRQADGGWLLGAGDLAGLTLAPPPDFAGTLELTLRATASEARSGSAATEAAFRVTVGAVADPALVQAGGEGLEDQPIALELAAALTDLDESERLVLTLQGVPAGASLSAGTRNADGSWSLTREQLSGLSLTPPRDFSGRIALTFLAKSVDNDNSTVLARVSFTVDVAGVADAPDLRTGPVRGAEDSGIALRATALATDLDGSERIAAYRFAQIPQGAVLRADGRVLVTPARMASLTITPPPNSDTDFTLRVSAISAEPNGSRAESPALDLPVSVHAVADAPVITGSGGAGLEDGAVPLDLSVTLPDVDGSERLFFLVSGLPGGGRGCLRACRAARGPGR